MYTIYYILNNRMDFARAATIEEARKCEGKLIMAGASIECVKDQNGEIVILQAPEYMTIKELKEILANMPEDCYACVEGGEDGQGGWGSFYISSQTPDHWMEADRINILDYQE